MEIVNILLNFVGLGLWVGAFVLPRYAVRSSRPLTLLSTLRSETPSGHERFLMVGFLIGLLGLRALGYWNFSTPGALPPSVDFGVLSVSFRLDSLVHMLTYSVSSFVVFIYLYHLWALGLSFTCRHGGRIDSIENLVNQQLGGVAFWHPGWKVLLSVVGGVGLWIVARSILIVIEALPRDWSFFVIVTQSAVVVASLWLSFLIVVIVVLFLHLLHSYVYLGEQAIWVFTDRIAKVYLLPFRRLPLLLGRFDFAPIFGILVFWFLYRLGDWGIRAVLKHLSG
ncbi:MAG: hypothetical protein M2R45_00658 [Verrucomicrobia subdivision 3 bacterium]|nr:hypothetical protein [Limisphaerales bacterium]MCS1414459.1 hypothetical protein [Limisphaerales bacterium]